MNSPHCSQLDDFLDGQLTASAAELFTSHLPACETCREAVRFEQHVRQALVTEQINIRPVAEVVSLGRKILRTERRRAASTRMLLGGLAAACILGTWVWLSPSEPLPDNQFAVQPPVQISPPPNEPAAEPPQVELPSVEAQTVDVAALEAGKAQVRMIPGPGQQYMAVPQPTRDSRVTFVMLYPAVTPREPAAETPMNTNSP